MPAARPVTLQAVIAHQARRQPDQAAVISAGRTTSYSELDHDSDRYALAFHTAGARPGSRVAFLGKESVHYWVATFACAKLGAVLVPVNWRLTVREVDHILRDSGTELLLVDGEHLPVATAVRQRLPGLHTVLCVDAEPTDRDGLAGRVAALPADAVLDEQNHEDDRRAVVQIYTSGTSGLPKGVVLAHRSFFNVAEAMDSHGLDWFDWRPGDRSLIGMPGFHIGGLSYAMQAFNAGVTIVSMPMFISSEAVRLIRDLRVTTAIVAPAMLQMMLAERAADRGALASLRKVVYGGSPITSAVLQQALDRLDCEFLQIYGSSETGNFAVCLPPADHVPGSPRLRTAGRPYPGIEIRVEGADGAEVPVGEIGEICVHSPARMIEYWGLPDATAHTLTADGWIRMGDAGFVDADGYVTVCDRVHDMVIVAGENVYPTEIEDAITAHPAVAQAAVVGLPHDSWGEQVHARIVWVPSAHVTVRELMVFLRGTLADFKIPTSFDFVDALPRNPSGKILRRDVRADLTTRTEATS